VHGLALDPPTTPAVFDVAAVGAVLASDQRVDLRSGPDTLRAVGRVAPELVLHLAAQPLVRDSYRDPGATYATNVAGTAHLLAALSEADTRPQAVVIVTSDKVYAPAADGAAHTEASALGGTDPYSSSKALTEQVVAVFRNLPAIDGRPAWDIPMATARAGNVIGGGDWARDRLVPDCVRSFAAGMPVELRYPAAVRPWQHVLDPLAGYLLLAEDLASGNAKGLAAVNFGPVDCGGRGAERRRGGSRGGCLWGVDGSLVVERPDPAAPETGELRLDSSLAMSTLGWSPRWDTREALRGRSTGTARTTMARTWRPSPMRRSEEYAGA
jgi:CDP-glucose 4,6-dehydratase